MAELSTHDILCNLLVELGFNQTVASAVLKECEDDLENAIRLLLDNEKSRQGRKTELRSLSNLENFCKIYAPGVEPQPVKNLSEQPPKMTCDICGKKVLKEGFESHRSGKRHVQAYLQKRKKNKIRVQSVEEEHVKRFLCPKCHKYFANGGKKHHHVRNCKAGFCETCNKALPDLVSYKNHRKTPEHVECYFVLKQLSGEVKPVEERALRRLQCELCGVITANVGEHKQSAHPWGSISIPSEYEGVEFVVNPPSENYVDGYDSSIYVGNSRCIVCRDGVASVSVDPCGHLCFCTSFLCQAYMNSTGQCPSCGNPGEILPVC